MIAITFAIVTFADSSAALQQQETELRVRLLEPTEDTYVTGLTRLRAQVTPVSDTAIARLVFSVDGAVVAVIEQEPWEALWNAGESFNRHLIEVHVVDAVGREAEDGIVTRDLETAVFRAEVSAVLLYVSVLDSRGAFVPGLERQDFEVFEDGKRQEITHFSTEPRPMVAGLLMDTSGSMQGPKMVRARQGALAFLDQIGEQDELFIMSFDTYPNLLQDLTNNVRVLRESLDEVQVGGATSLNLAIVEGVDILTDRPERRALIVLSDGYDTTQTITTNQAQDYARRQDVRVFTIGIFDSSNARDLRGRRRGFDALNPGEGSLRSFADGTGGRSIILDSLAELQRAYEDIARELRSQYALAYQPSDPPGDGEWHDIAVKAEGGDEARTKPGYYGGEQN